MEKAILIVFCPICKNVLIEKSKTDVSKHFFMKVYLLMIN